MYLLAVLFLYRRHGKVQDMAFAKDHVAEKLSGGTPRTEEKVSIRKNRLPLSSLFYVIPMLSGRRI